MLAIASIIALIIAITIHEFAHALVADRLGDPTPRSYGRLTLNPLAHADPLGTFILPLVGALTGIPTIGWAKPVPIDPYNLKNPRRDELLISLAGPISNLLLASLTAVIINTRLLGSANPFLFLIVLVNVSLCIFNLIPLAPLDGSKILLNLIPIDKSTDWEEALNRYSLPLLLILLFLPVGSSSLLQIIINPPITFLLKLLLP